MGGCDECCRVALQRCRVLQRIHTLLESWQPVRVPTAGWAPSLLSCSNGLLPPHFLCTYRCDPHASSLSFTYCFSSACRLSGVPSLPCWGF